jgi:hypothetical protein
LPLQALGKQRAASEPAKPTARSNGLHISINNS